jgi:hypothetical protein
LSDPIKRVKEDKRLRAEAVSAAAKVNKIMPRKSSLVCEKFIEYRVARVNDVASKLRIAIRIWWRCLAAETSATNAANMKTGWRCIA